MRTTLKSKAAVDLHALHPAAAPRQASHQSCIRSTQRVETSKQRRRTKHNKCRRTCAGSSCSSAVSMSIAASMAPQSSLNRGKSGIERKKKEKSGVHPWAPAAAPPPASRLCIEQKQKKMNRTCKRTCAGSSCSSAVSISIVASVVPAPGSSSEGCE